MEDVLERLKSQMHKNVIDENVTVKHDDLLELIQEYEIETGIKKQWLDEWW